MRTVEPSHLSEPSPGKSFIRDILGQEINLGDIVAFHAQNVGTHVAKVTDLSYILNRNGERTIGVDCWLGERKSVAANKVVILNPAYKGIPRRFHEPQDHETTRTYLKHGQDQQGDFFQTGEHVYQFIRGGVEIVRVTTFPTETVLGASRPLVHSYHRNRTELLSTACLRMKDGLDEVSDDVPNSWMGQFHTFADGS